MGKDQVYVCLVGLFFESTRRTSHESKTYLTRSFSIENWIFIESVRNIKPARRVTS